MGPELKYTWASFGAILYLRMALSFRLTKTLGPLLKIIFSMFKDVMIFMALESFILLSFAFIGVSLFYEI